MIAVLFGTFCCGIICLRQILVKVTNVSMYVLVMQLFFGLMGAMSGLGFGLLIVTYGQVGTTAWDNIFIIDKILNNGN